jgi:hypothetical protein
MGFIHIWIENYSTITRPLINLTQKGKAFTWDNKHTTAMQSLKDAIIGSPTLISINYTSDHPVYLAVDLSIHPWCWIDSLSKVPRWGTLPSTFWFHLMKQT